MLVPRMVFSAKVLHCLVDTIKDTPWTASSIPIQAGNKPTIGMGRFQQYYPPEHDVVFSLPTPPQKRLKHYIIIIKREMDLYFCLITCYYKLFCFWNHISIPTNPRCSCFFPYSSLLTTTSNMSRDFWSEFPRCEPTMTWWGNSDMQGDPWKPGIAWLVEYDGDDQKTLHSFIEGSLNRNFRQYGQLKSRVK